MEYTAILEKQILGRLKVDNPWWTEGKVPSFYGKMSPRLYLDIFYPLVKDVDIQRAIILMGPRRVGKTVMIYHSIKKLIDEGVSPQNIIMCRWKLRYITIFFWSNCLIWHVRFLARRRARSSFLSFLTRYNI